MKDSELDTRGYAREWRRRQGGLGFWIRPMQQYFSESYGAEDLQRSLFGLLAAISFVLLIVCVNVGNLMLARAERRQQEMAIRAALGAGRARLLRQLLIESLLLACAGGVAGLVVTMWGMNLLASMIPESMPRLRPLQIDGSALCFTLVVSLATALIFGLAPALRASRTAIGDALKQAGTSTTIGAGWRRYRALLVVTEVALSLILLMGAGLMIQSVTRLLHVNPGFDPENLLFVGVSLPWERYNNAGDLQRATNLRNTLFARLHERLRALPGVQAVGVEKENFPTKFSIDDRPEPVQLYHFGCGFGETDPFLTMRVPLLAGRYFDDHDLSPGLFFENDIIAGTSTVIINETAARMLWPGEPVVGKSFRGFGPKSLRRYQIVGVVGDVREYKYNQPTVPILYRPYHELGLEGGLPSFVIRTHSDPSALVPAIRRELKAADPGMRMPLIRIAKQTLYDSTQAHRTYMSYLIVFAAVGLLLSALGIYGVLAYSVARRTREIGIRMAVGAQRRDVLCLVLSEGAWLILMGIVAGVLGALALTRLLRQQLFQVSPTDPVVLIAVVLLLGCVALLACLLPAARASRIDPQEALRCEG
jgi:putative ABC transport system permease protein